MEVMQHTFLQKVSHYSTDSQLTAVKQQRNVANVPAKGREEEEDLTLTNMAPNI